MYIEEFVDYCMNKKGSSQEFPFDNKTMVFKVYGKMFALSNVQEWYDGKARINLKNKPEENIHLRSNYESIIPGYHMNKKHWNTIEVWKEELSKEEILEMIDISYTLVLEKIPERIKNQEK